MRLVNFGNIRKTLKQKTQQEDSHSCLFLSSNIWYASNHKKAEI
jgi:hypothetical protein